MRHVINYLKHNALATVALFIALGGTSYAAVAIPRNSVGTRQLRNGAVTAAKLHNGAVGQRILFSASISGVGRVLNSYPRGAHVTGWNIDSGASVYGGFISWHRAIPKNCSAFGNAEGVDVGPQGYPSANVSIVTGAAKIAKIEVGLADPAAVNVIVVCPSR